MQQFRESSKILAEILIEFSRLLFKFYILFKFLIIFFRLKSQLYLDIKILDIAISWLEIRDKRDQDGILINYEGNTKTMVVKIIYLKKKLKYVYLFVQP